MGKEGVNNFNCPHVEYVQLVGRPVFIPTCKHPDAKSVEEVHMISGKVVSASVNRPRCKPGCPECPLFGLEK